MSYAQEQIQRLLDNMKDVNRRLDRAETKLDLIETYLDDIEGLYNDPVGLVEATKILKNGFDTIDEEEYDPTMIQLD